MRYNEFKPLYDALFTAMRRETGNAYDAMRRHITYDKLVKMGNAHGVDMLLKCMTAELITYDCESVTLYKYWRENGGTNEVRWGSNGDMLRSIEAALAAATFGDTEQLSDMVMLIMQHDQEQQKCLLNS